MKANAPDAIGIDLGTCFIKIAGVKRGNIQIICDETSKRELPFLVGLGDGQRNIGASAFNGMKRNYLNTVKFATRFLGAQSDDKHLKKERKWLLSKEQVSKDSQGRFAFSVWAFSDV